MPRIKIEIKNQRPRVTTESKVVALFYADGEIDKKKRRAYYGYVRKIGGDGKLTVGGYEFRSSSEKCSNDIYLNSRRPTHNLAHALEHRAVIFAVEKIVDSVTNRNRRGLLQRVLDLFDPFPSQTRHRRLDDLKVNGDTVTYEIKDGRGRRIGTEFKIVMASSMLGQADILVRSLNQAVDEANRIINGETGS